MNFYVQTIIKVFQHVPPPGEGVHVGTIKVLSFIRSIQNGVELTINSIQDKKLKFLRFQILLIQVTCII